MLLDDLDLWVSEENRLNFEWEGGLKHLFKLLAQRCHGENPDNIDIGGLDTIYDLKGVATWLGAGLDQLFYLALLGMGEWHWQCGKCFDKNRAPPFHRLRRILVGYDFGTVIRNFFFFFAVSSRSARSPLPSE